MMEISNFAKINSCKNFLNIYKLTTDIDKKLTFSLAGAFDFVLSLGVTTPLITPVMEMSCSGSVGKDCFGMLKSVGFGNLVGLFASSRRSGRVYLG